ncbi:hypothetical protein IWX49DRAFT_94107 [Phyllosticta citricarpa]|uniref:Peptidase S9 prolyl oligopeptidase catalytic domain-containing protein n=2 Tax=Phyllosticta TaxID=121621 RepID=A0ABR1LEG9_9PEZI
MFSSPALLLAFLGLSIDVVESFRPAAMLPQMSLNPPSRSQPHAMLAFSPVWQLLGPFQIGTREAPWGADPLEYYGGFRALEYNDSSIFRSSLTPNGTVKWSKVTGDASTTHGGGANASVTVEFPQVDWDFLSNVYGWSSTQYQAWIRGSINVDGEGIKTALLYTDFLLEFWLDGVPYFGGDFYGFRKAPPVLHLGPGSHRLDIRLSRDVRSLGGIGEINFPVNLELVPAGRSGPLELADGVLIPDAIDGKPAGRYGSIAVRNVGFEDIEVISVKSLTIGWTIENLTRPTKLVPGQTRPIPFELSSDGSSASKMELEICYTRQHNGVSSLTTTQDLKTISAYEPHKVTFLHPGGIVSYAILRPPSKTAACGRATFAPVLLQLHGAGLEADNPEWRRVLEPLPDLCAWVLLPTGATPWSGDDWHAWGFADVEAATASIPTWIKDHGWAGPGVDTDRWLVAGHSNGGQGVWYTMTHRPDKIIAAAPVSGYLSIEKYVPYEFWAPMDPRKQSILRASLNSYRHEMLAENCKGIPILQQHGGRDTNVPNYHSRFMSQLLLQAGAPSTYVERPGEDHYHDGVMTTPSLSELYRKFVPNGNASSLSLKSFSIVVANPGDMGSKGGIKVTQLITPGQYARMDVTLDPLNEETCLYQIKTSNVLSFRITPQSCTDAHVAIDRSTVATSIKRSHGESEFRKSDGFWKQTSPIAPFRQVMQYRRQGRQLGQMDAILRSNGSFVINHHGGDTYGIALQISRNFYQYFSADSVIGHGSAATGNSILIVTGQRLAESPVASFPIRVTGSSEIRLVDNEGEEHIYEGEGISAIFLRPAAKVVHGNHVVEQENLELVIWAPSARQAANAARLVPMLTGGGQPDFIVLGNSSKWKGVEGTLAMGFYDDQWRIVGSSIFT